MSKKIVDLTTVKATWDTIVWCYGGDVSVKEVKLHSLRKSYENISMKNNENVSEYISRVIVVMNKMKACGETFFEQVIIEKSEVSNLDEKKHKNGDGSHKFGHFAADYWPKKERKDEEANIAIGDFKGELVLLMAFEKEGGKWWTD
ncbi:uncharacterized protein LOC131661714 [Vicia villosa]|uniref:uncharacterized protein LOC131661714 n=1 Tax=Vicia villosa TaxID=3911 RepID=UPI00273CDB1B|nr:uncharacterized protein LOC131661714 [Vicia villosa]